MCQHRCTFVSLDAAAAEVLCFVPRRTSIIIEDGIPRQNSLFAKRKTTVLVASKTRKQNCKKKPTTLLKSDDDQSSTATINKPAQLAGIIEDHRYEQFFYDEATAKQLYQLVKLYDRPLLMCNPTLAVLAEGDDQEYRLLDRDTRFNFLNGYVEFSLTEPHMIKDYDFDSVFIDPPFANVTPEQMAQCLRLISADDCPLWVAYNSRREEQLLDALNELDGPDLVPKWKLSYKEGVSASTQDAIWLYGPKE
jgi:16S rRNA G966 N2-methylase RsmD